MAARIRQAGYIGDPRVSFHADELAEIVGVRIVTPPSSASCREPKPRAAFVLRYVNGDEDYVPIAEAIDRGFVVTWPTGEPVDSDAGRD